LASASASASVEGDDAVDPDAADVTDPFEEPEPAEVDDDVDPDAEELSGLWSAGFNRLPTSRPQPPANTERQRAAMPAPRRGVIDIQIPLTTLMCC
jgi:hypothetical protein